MKKFNSNETAIPRKPEKAEAQATRCLSVLLKGGAINRKTLDKLKIGEYNGSAHSLISLLRNTRYIPINSYRVKNETCDYLMSQEEIMRYNDPILRSQQREEMKRQVVDKRARKACKQFLTLLDRLDECPQLWQYVPTLPEVLDAIEKKLSALLFRKKGSN